MKKYFESFLESLDLLLQWFSSGIKQNTGSYCDLETADSETVLVDRYGSLVSIIKISGIKKAVGKEEFATLQEQFTIALQRSMSKTGHIVQFIFHHDYTEAKNLIHKHTKGAMKTCTRLQLDMNDLFQEKINHLSRFCSDETVYIVLWTKREQLSHEENKRFAQMNTQWIKKNKIPPFKLAQNILLTVDALRTTHDAFVNALMNDLYKMDIVASVLEVHEAIFQIRQMGDPDFTDPLWRAILPGDKIPVKEYQAFTGNITDILWPSLKKQIFPRDAINLNPKIVLVGDKLYASVFIDLLPQQLKTFSFLLQRVLLANIPWRISFFIESDAKADIRFKAILASILSFSSSKNKLISNANNIIEHLALHTDEAIVRLKITACTWAKETEENLLKERLSELTKAIEGWGSCDVSESCGDPFEGWVATLPAVSYNHVATATIAPLSEVVGLLPLTRPASPWFSGAQLFRTLDGKIWPFQLGSSQQTTWVDLIYAKPGSGKSVLSNTLNFSLCVAEGLKQLPRISIIDIGPSSSGFISLIKEALPKDQKHLVAYYKLRMIPQHAINPFGTQLGVRYPTALERSFLINFISLLVTPIGVETAYSAMTDIIGMVVDEVYQHFSDESQPNLYTASIEPGIDILLKDIDFHIDAHTSWWEITDALFLAGFIHEAKQAQKYATPLLSDLISICHIPAFKDLYGNIKINTGEYLIEAFTRMISYIIREYPSLSNITRFDIGEAKIVSLDLDEVSKGGGTIADQQTTIMYMLSYYSLTRDFYLSQDDIKNFPLAYQRFHEKILLNAKEDQKRLVLDEFHRTNKVQALRNQIILDMREGRKWNVQIALISQSIDDFDAVMIELASSIYIMNAGSKPSLDRSAQIFGLNETEKEILEKYVHGPSALGATFLAQFSTNIGKCTQVLVLTASAVELWAFSTTVEDVYIRDHLYQVMPPQKARSLLAKHFPSGSIRQYIDNKFNAMQQESSDAEGLLKKKIIDNLIISLKDKAYS